eukprot:Skav223330  [mRNA]  locus=scaffold200:129914:130486:- [translate_table: standard]
MSCSCRLHVVAQGLVQAVHIVGILRDIVCFTHEVVNERVRQGIIPGSAYDLNGMVDLLLTHLQVQLQSHGVLLAVGVMSCRICQEVALLIVLGNSFVLISGAVVCKASFIGGHLILPFSKKEGLLIVFGQEVELHGPGHVAILPAILGHPFGARSQLGLANQLEGLLRLVQLVQRNPHHAVQITSPFIGH